jgi:hypothetical protein
MQRFTLIEIVDILLPTQTEQLLYELEQFTQELEQLVQTV